MREPNPTSERAAKEIVAELGLDWDDCPTIAQILANHFQTTMEDCERNLVPLDLNAVRKFAEYLRATGTSSRIAKETGATETCRWELQQPEELRSERFWKPGCGSNFSPCESYFDDFHHPKFCQFCGKLVELD